MLWSRVGTRVPSTISTVPWRNRFRWCSAISGPVWSTIRSAADLDTPNNGASWRKVRLVRQYAATSSIRSSSGSAQGGRAEPHRLPPAAAE